MVYPTPRMTKAVSAFMRRISYHESMLHKPVRCNTTPATFASIGSMIHRRPFGLKSFYSLSSSRGFRSLVVYRHIYPGTNSLWEKNIPPRTSVRKREKHADASDTNGANISSNIAYQVSTIPSVGMDSKWRTMTEAILDLPVGSFNQGRWNEAITVLTHWFGNNRYENFNSGAGKDQHTAIKCCWKLLDRMCSELEEISKNKSDVDMVWTQSSPTLSAVEVLNPILLLWRDEFLDYHRSSRTLRNYKSKSDNNDSVAGKDQSWPSNDPLLPSQVVELLRRYQKLKLVAMDTATHAIVLDTAGKYSSILAKKTVGGERINEETQKHLQLQNEMSGDSSGNHHNEGVLFADRYLNEWIEGYKKSQHSYSGNTDNDDSHQIRSPNQLHDTTMHPRPDIVAFGTIVHAWVESGLPGAPMKAEAWAKVLDDLDEKYPNKSESTNEKESKRKLYTSVLLAWARSGNPIKAKEWIDRMIREKEYPDIQTFNCLLMAYQAAAAKASDNPNDTNRFEYAERAEEVLRHMQKLYHDSTGFLSHPPNVVSYNLVIDTWTKRAGLESFRRSKGGAIDAARRAHGWMEQMKDSGIHPNTVTYNTVITAYSRAGFPQNSEKLLKEMIAIYQNEQDCSSSNNLPATRDDQNEEKKVDAALFDKYASMTTTKPDVQSFTSVLAGWARVGTLEAAQRADELLRVMQLPEVNIEPNVETYGSCIHCWARVAAGTHSGGNKSKQQGKIARDQREQAVQRAEALYREMTEDRKILPDVYAYTGLLNVYGRSGRSRKASEFLDTCLDEYNRTGDPRMKPTVVTFTAILNAWSKGSNAPEAAEKAHELLRRMKDEYGVKPNAFSYSSVLDAYSRSDHPDAAKKAFSLFRNMREVEGLEPNGYTCSNVLKAMARGGKVEEAENLLRELVEDTSVRTKLGPHAFSSVLYGWSKSKRRDAPERAEALLIDMQKLYDKNLIDGPPNSVCWNNVLACWAAHSDLPGAAQRAEDLLRRIQQQQEEATKLHELPRQNKFLIRCNRIMYNTVMNAWANNGNFARVLILYDELNVKSVYDTSLSPPDEWTYRALWKAIVKTNQIGANEKLSRLLVVIQILEEIGLQPDKNMKADLHLFRNQFSEEVNIDKEMTKETLDKIEIEAKINEEESKPSIDFSKLTVAQLRDECRKRELKVSGRKKELVERIEESIIPKMYTNKSLT